MGQRIADKQARGNEGPLGPAILSYPFRPFFLLAALHAAVVLPVWLAILYGGLGPPAALPPAAWHAHQLLFGTVPAAIAGFLLTAMCTWTGRAPLQGVPLAGLALLWLAGRLTMGLPALLPPLMTALIDLGFIAAVMVIAARVIGGAGNRRNYPLVGVLLLLSGANGMMHLGFTGAGGADLLYAGETLALDLLLLLIAVIGGRITPAFSINWLRLQGGPADAPRQFAALDRAALLAVALLLPLDWPGLPAWPAALAALAAGTLNLCRLLLWRPWLYRREALLWVLHLGYAWLCLALLLKGAGVFMDALPARLWIHAAGVGTIGTMLLGVMSRVSLGHTGRPLALPRGGVWMYYLVNAAALGRLAFALGWWTSPLALTLAGLAWSAAFALFLILYTPILISPRVDLR